jgi:hypothetical protein
MRFFFVLISYNNSKHKLLFTILEKRKCPNKIFELYILFRGGPGATAPVAST